MGNTDWQADAFSQWDKCLDGHEMEPPGRFEVYPGHTKWLALDFESNAHARDSRWPE